MVAHLQIDAEYHSDHSCGKPINKNTVLLDFPNFKRKDSVEEWVQLMKAKQIPSSPTFELSVVIGDAVVGDV